VDLFSGVPEAPNDAQREPPAQRFQSFADFLCQLICRLLLDSSAAGLHTKFSTLEAAANDRSDVTNMSDVQQSSFLAKTFAMLSDDANSDAIRWGHNGTTLIIGLVRRSSASCRVMSRQCVLLFCGAPSA
jgi:hypothetical protein